MERLQAYKFELRPDGAQRRLMRRFAGCCRYVYNRALAGQNARYECGEKKLGYAGLCKELTAWLSLWSLASSPLLLGSDLRYLAPQDLALLKNRAVLAVDQDGMAARRIRNAPTEQVFAIDPNHGSCTDVHHGFATAAL